MKFVVTGATGFIGRHVVALLLEQGHDVLGVTRDASRLAPKPGLTVFQADLAEEPNAALMREITEADCLIHLAWNGLPNYMSRHHFEDELPRQYRFLKAAIENGAKKIFISGTCFEYGLKNGCLTPDTPCDPVTAYGLAKDTLRRQLFFLTNNLPVILIWGRLFYVYGEGQHTNSLYPQLCKAAREGQSVFNMSAGDQIRDYLYIEDLSKSIVSRLMYISANDVINICSEQPRSVRSLVEYWIMINNWHIKLALGFYPYSNIEPFAFWGKK